MGMRNRLIALGVVASAIAGLSFASPAEAQKRVLYLDHVGPGAHDHPSRVNARAAMTAIAQASNGLFTDRPAHGSDGPRRGRARAL